METEIQLYLLIEISLNKVKLYRCFYWGATQWPWPFSKEKKNSSLSLHYSQRGKQAFWLISYTNMFEFLLRAKNTISRCNYVVEQFKNKSRITLIWKNENTFTNTMQRIWNQLRTRCFLERHIPDFFSNSSKTCCLPL